MNESGDDEIDSFLRAAARIEPRAAPEGDRTGARVGRFVLDRKLGSGAMGVVYAATDPVLRREVALKLLPSSYAADDERRRRFLREARAASAVSHPGIAQVYEAGEDGDQLYLAMQLVGGETLRARLGRDGRFEPREAAWLARDLAIALAAAHDAGIVHRDLKPENVIVDREGRAKILDFGLAKAQEGARDGAPSVVASELGTEDGRILGTPSYMSPEQARGRPVDARSDLFALGVILHELLAGERPFRGETPMEVLIAIDRDAPAPLPRDVPAPLQRVVRACLAKARDARPASARDVAALLDDYLAGKTAARRPLVYAAAAIAILASAAAYVASRRAGHPVPEEPPSIASVAAIVAPLPVPIGSVDAPAAASDAAPPPSATPPSVHAPRSKRPPLPAIDPLAHQK